MGSIKHTRLRKWYLKINSISPCHPDLLFTSSLGAKTTIIYAGCRHGLLNWKLLIQLSLWYPQLPGVGIGDIPHMGDPSSSWSVCMIA